MTHRKSGYSINGFEQALVLLRGLDDAGRERILAGILAQDPALAARLRSELVSFADLIGLEMRELQELVRAAPERTMCLALRGAPQPMLDRLKTSLPARHWDLLQEMIRTLGPRSLAQIEQARAEVLRIAQELESQGRLLIRKRQARG